MTTGGRLRLAAGIAAIAVSLAATGLWWADGAWENAAMPTHGVERVLLLAGGSLLCFLAAAWLGRERR